MTADYSNLKWQVNIYITGGALNLDSDDGKSNSSGSEEEPLVKRQSKRKKSAPTYTFPQVLDMVKVLPVIDVSSFKEFYETKRQQKKARARARKAKIEPLVVLICWCWLANYRAENTA